MMAESWNKHESPQGEREYPPNEPTPPRVKCPLRLIPQNIQPDVHLAFKELLATKLAQDCLDHSQDGYEPGDEKAPFFSGAYLYDLVGKDNARTILGNIRRLGESLGITGRFLP